MVSATSWVIAASIGTVSLLGTAAHAGLGAGRSSIAIDGARMGARVSSESMGRYAHNQLTRSNGALVHEYTNANGEVFAVSWSGPGKPDLRSLLGSYFARFQAASASSGRSMHALRRPVQVSQPDLQIQTAGHMGWFRGIAYIPSLAPDGVKAADLPTP